MPLRPDELEVTFEGCPFGVSARRIYEHMTLGQINPFGRQPDGRYACARFHLILNQPSAYSNAELCLNSDKSRSDPVLRRLH